MIFSVTLIGTFFILLPIFLAIYFREKIEQFIKKWIPKNTENNKEEKQNEPN